MTNNILVRIKLTNEELSSIKTYQRLTRFSFNESLNHMISFNEKPLNDIMLKKCNTFQKG